MQQGNKQIFVVLGMARSGTSAITRGLKALDVDLGERLTPPCKWHPKGFWEDNDIVYLVNEKLLNVLNADWESLRFFAADSFKSPQISALKQNAIKILKKRFTNTHEWGFKDPRTVRVLTFWQEIFAEMQLSEHYIIALRNPLAAAKSYQRLTGADLEHGLMLWVVHAFNALEQTQLKKTIVVSFESLLQSPQTELLRIQKEFNLTKVQSDEVNAYASQFLNKDLKHHDISMSDLEQHKATSMAPLCIELYSLLIKLAADEMHFASPDFTEQWQTLKNKMTNATDFYDYMDSLYQRKAKVQRYIHVLHKSRLWKFISPLKKADDFLRNRRIEKRNKNRHKAAGLANVY